jgi:hypothetical protein
MPGKEVLRGTSLPYKLFQLFYLPAFEIDMKYKIKTVDFWGNFELNSLDLIGEFICELCQQADDPDILLYSVFGKEHLKYDSAKILKIFFTGEDVVPDFSECHYALSFSRMVHPRHLRLPLYRLHKDYARLLTCAEWQDAMFTEREFCNFIYSVSNAHRENIFDWLATYKFIHAPGKRRHNSPPIGSDDASSSRGMVDWQAQKNMYQTQFKFTISCENAASAGYITEKITDAFLAKSIPIYWGTPDIVEDFNPKCFINVADFASLESLKEYVKQVDQDPQLYRSYFEEAPIVNKGLIESLSEANIKSFLIKAFDMAFPELDTKIPSKKKKHSNPLARILGKLMAPW